MFDASPFIPAQPVATCDGERLTALCGPVATFNAGSEIYAEGDQAGALYQVAFGVVRVYRLLADGRRQICAFHMAGDVFGFEAGNERHVFADAVTLAGLRTLKAGSQADLSRELYRLAMQSLTHAHDHLLTLGRNDAAGRVAAFLIEMADRQGTRDDNRVALPMSRTDIADYLGLTIETVSRVLTRMKEARVLRLASSRDVQVLRWEALEDMTA
ncbi:transcriptional regulator [Asticcacaulis sp. AC460]|uniref:helix-turn-helix domain-containing protein n=1 Tax=Asticcacaulis sp. AC460 TaxID=1282360 RepID=UPI0003C3AE3C|nr:helix-turn-helix domain-containing protein [Asticcacaulis sp. AC460]ESQ91053.1 transcriptional regulator [Asticcacaulis sp. AC460]